MNETKFKLRDYLILVTYAILLFLAVSNISQVLGFLRNVLTVLMPFILGILFAYILNILMSFLERKLFWRLGNSKKPFIRKLKRPISIASAFVIVFAFISIVMLFVVPQFTKSILTLRANIPGYLDSVEELFYNLSDRFNLSGDLWNVIASNWNQIISQVTGFISTALPRILVFTLGLTNGIINFIMGLIVTIYLLATKEKLIIILKKLIYAFTSRHTADRLIEIGVHSNKTFQSFISGQLTEALILGFLVFIGMLIFRFPFAVLCAVIIAVTSLIPIFGAWIGIVPCVFIILMADPSKALWFILFIVILQQLENNLIYPKVVGDSIGLDGLWVLFAIIVGGSLFGLAGMLLGIPTFAVIYAIIRRITNRRLREKNIEVR